MPSPPLSAASTSFFTLFCNDGPMSCAGTVLPTTTGLLSVSSAKNTTSEFVACLIAPASESSI